MFQGTSKQDFTLKCCKVYNYNDSAVFICVKPKCKQNPICCKICIEERHCNHSKKELIQINKIDQIDSLNLNTFLNEFNQKELIIKESLNNMRSLFIKLDFVKQFQEQPSRELLILISQWIKSERNLSEELMNVIKEQIQQINHQIDEMAIYLKNFTFSQIVSKAQADELYDKAQDYCQKQQYPEALLWLEKALIIDKQHLKALINKAEILIILSKYKESVEFADKALAIEPLNIQALRTKSESLRFLGRYQESLECADQGLAIQPIHKQLLYAKSDSLRFLSRYEEAIKFADKALEIDKNYPQVLSTKADSLRLLNRYQEAIEFANRAIATNPKFNDPYITKSAALIELGQYDNALVVINQALEVNPNNPFAENVKNIILMTMECDSEES